MKRIPVTTATALIAFSAFPLLHGLSQDLTLGAGSWLGQDRPIRKERPARSPSLSETSLGRKHPGFIEHSLAISPDGNHIAYVVNQGSSKSVVLDGRLGKPYPDIPEQPLTERGRDPQIRFSPDGKRIAYVAQSPSGYFVVVDGVEGKSFESISVGAPVFSPDSRRVAYIARRAGKETVVVDGIEDPPCDYIQAVPIRFSPDSKHIGYPARRGESTVVIIDGREIDRAQYIGPVRFSPDGRRYAYVVMNGETRRVVVDGTPGRQYSRVGNEILFSPDGRHVLYRATGAGGDFIVLDGQEGKYRGIIRENDYDFSPTGRPLYLVDRGPAEIYVVIGQETSGPYDRVIGMPRFSADGSRFAFAVRRVDGKQTVIVDGAAGPAFDRIDTLAFSPRGNRLLYTSSRGPRHYAVLDGALTDYDAVALPTFSPDGDHFALSVRIDGQWAVSVDGNKATPACEQCSQIALSSGGKHLGFVCQRGQHQVAVIDREEGKHYDSLGPVAFTSDGGAAYIATRKARTIVVIDTAEIAEFDSILTPLIVDGPSSLRFLAFKNGEFFREQIRLEK